MFLSCLCCFSQEGPCNEIIIFVIVFLLPTFIFISFLNNFLKMVWSYSLFHAPASSQWLFKWIAFSFVKTIQNIWVSVLGFNCDPIHEPRQNDPNQRGFLKLPEEECHSLGITQYDFSLLCQPFSCVWHPPKILNSFNKLNNPSPSQSPCIHVMHLYKGHSL